MSLLSGYAISRLLDSVCNDAPAFALPTYLSSDALGVASSTLNAKEGPSAELPVTDQQGEIV